MDLSLENKKIELIQWLSTLNDTSLIDKLMKLREKEKNDWWNEISASEKESIEKALEKNRYNRTAAARFLGITVRSMRYRMERLGMNVKK